MKDLLKNCILYVTKCVLSIIKVFPLKNTIMFCTNSGAGFFCNPKYLYKYLSKEISDRIKADAEANCKPRVAFDEEKVIRRDSTRDNATVLRTAFIRDIDKILHCPYYNRYADKTQVFSFNKK